MLKMYSNELRAFCPIVVSDVLLNEIFQDIPYTIEFQKFCHASVFRVYATVSALYAIFLILCL